MENMTYHAFPLRPLDRKRFTSSRCTLVTKSIPSPSFLASALRTGGTGFNLLNFILLLQYFNVKIFCVNTKIFSIMNKLNTINNNYPYGNLLLREGYTLAQLFQ